MCVRKLSLREADSRVKSATFPCVTPLSPFERGSVSPSPPEVVDTSADWLGVFFPLRTMNDGGRSYSPETPRRGDLHALRAARSESNPFISPVALNTHALARLRTRNARGSNKYTHIRAKFVCSTVNVKSCPNYSTTEGTIAGLRGKKVKTFLYTSAQKQQLTVELAC